MSPYLRRRTVLVLRLLGIAVIQLHCGLSYIVGY